jgi:hypothetical protein
VGRAITGIILGGLWSVLWLLWLGTAVFLHR